MKRTFVIDPQGNRNWPQVISNVVSGINDWIKGGPVQITLDEPTRSLEQNAMLHAICGEIAQQKQWAGRRIDAEGWKRLLVDAWARESDRRQGDVVPSLDGASIVNLSMQTRRMTVADMADLITFAQWWATDNDVKLRDVAPLRDQRLADEARAA